MSAALWGWLPADSTVPCHGKKVSSSFSCWHHNFKPVFQKLRLGCVVSEKWFSSKSQHNTVSLQEKANKLYHLVNTSHQSILTYLPFSATVLKSHWSSIAEETALLHPNDLRTEQAPHFIKSNYLKKLVRRGVKTRATTEVFIISTSKISAMLSQTSPSPGSQLPAARIHVRAMCPIRKWQGIKNLTNGCVST